MDTTLRRALAIALLTALPLAQPAHAAPATLPAATADERITFDQYRDWRMQFIEQRQTQIAAELADKDLPEARRQRLERQKSYYDYFVAMPPDERDRRFHQRFDQIDANHDGVIDPAERAAWHDKRRAYYDRAPRQRIASGPASPH
jgi:hypothetical protein